MYEMETRIGSVVIEANEHAIKWEDGDIRETSIGWLDSPAQEMRFA